MVITFFINQKGTITFSSDELLYSVAQFFAVDVGYMSDFLRALLSSPTDEQIILDTCQIVSTDTSLVIVPFFKEIPPYTCSKTDAYAMLEQWERFLHSNQQQCVMTVPQPIITQNNPQLKRLQ